MRRRWPIVLALLLLWASRIAALEAFPLHNDEGLHLTRAVEVWNLHPFWQISDGKIINHWPIAVLYPQNAPVFVGRIATVFVALLGLAAGSAVARRLAGEHGTLGAAALWITTPYLFFYERMAFSDTEAGAFVVLSLWAALRLAGSGRGSDAVRMGAALALAALFKFTAVPFAFAPALVVLALGRQPMKRRVLNLIIAGAVVALCFSVPLGYLALRGGDFFSVAMGWIGAGSGGSENGAAANLARLWAQIAGFGTSLWTIMLVVGLALLPMLRRRVGAILLAALLVPLAVMTVFGSEVLPRHYAVALPLAVTLAGVGIGRGIQWVARRIDGKASEASKPSLTSMEVANELSAFVVVGLFAGLVPFAAQAYRDPGGLPLPPAMRSQYITDHSSGYGLREAVLALSETTNSSIPVIGSMFPDSCRRANFYAGNGQRLVCTEAPGRNEIDAALAQYGEVYVLADNAPNIGIDVATVQAEVEMVAVYPRPGEDEGSASVVLWRLRRRSS